MISLDSFTKLRTPLPPMLLEQANVHCSSRFIGLYYLWGKATWNDSRNSCTFPFFTVWRPYIEHIAIAIDLLEANLGADDQEPMHQLVCDREQQAVYLVPFQAADKLLLAQHPPAKALTPEEVIAEEQRLVKKLEAIANAEFQDLGMFERFFPPSPERHAAHVALVQWLDQYVDMPLINRYIELSNAGNSRAFFVLSAFITRCKASQEQLESLGHDS